MESPREFTPEANPPSGSTNGSGSQESQTHRLGCPAFGACQYGAITNPRPVRSDGGNSRFAQRRQHSQS
jgi:hypothetical protein